MATGKECFRIPERMTIRTEPSGTYFADDPSTAAAVTLSSVSPMTATFMSFGETQGTVPFVQKVALALDGVPPPVQVPSAPRTPQHQPSGSAQGPSAFGNSSTRSATATPTIITPPALH